MTASVGKRALFQLALCRLSAGFTLPSSTGWRGATRQATSTLAQSRRAILVPSAAATTTTEARVANLEAFEEWCDLKGVKRKVRVGRAEAVHGGSLGLVAKEKISKGEAALQVPFELCFSASTATAALPALEGFDGWTGAAGLIAAQLLHERSKGPASVWAPWLAVLPFAGEAGALDSPLFWTNDSDLAQLEKCRSQKLTP